MSQEQTTISDFSHSGKSVAGQLSLYALQSQQLAEVGYVDSVDLDVVVGLGLHLYAQIRRVDETWSEAVRHETIPLREEDARRLADWYTQWNSPSRGLLKITEAREAEGHGSAGAIELRDACQFVSAALSVPLERLFAPSSISAQRTTTAEVRNALRRHLGAGG